jgi:hypothetical protein
MSLSTHKFSRENIDGGFGIVVCFSVGLESKQEKANDSLRPHASPLRAQLRSITIEQTEYKR